jgi:four helix bundle protein
MVKEELNETLYWLELIIESGLVEKSLLENLMAENLELFKIIASSVITMKRKMNCQ